MKVELMNRQSLILACAVTVMVGPACALYAQLEKSRKSESQISRFQSLFQNIQLIDQQRGLRKLVFMSPANGISIGKSLCEINALELTPDQKSELIEIDRRYQKTISNERIQLMMEAPAQPANGSPLPEQFALSGTMANEVKEYIDSIWDLLLSHQRKELNLLFDRFETIRKGGVVRKNALADKLLVDLTIRTDSLSGEYFHKFISVLDAGQQKKITQVLGKNGLDLTSRTLEILLAQSDRKSITESVDTYSKRAKEDLEQQLGKQSAAIVLEFINRESGWRISIGGQVIRGSLPITAISESFRQFSRSSLYDGPEIFDNQIDPEALRQKIVEMRQRSATLQEEYRSNKINRIQFESVARKIGFEFELFKLGLILKSAPDRVRDDYLNAMIRRLVTTSGLQAVLLHESLIADLKLSPRQRARIESLSDQMHEDLLKSGSEIEHEFWKSMKPNEQGRQITAWTKREFRVQQGVTPCPTFLLWNSTSPQLVFPPKGNGQ